MKDLPLDRTVWWWWLLIYNYIINYILKIKHDFKICVKQNTIVIFYWKDLFKSSMYVFRSTAVDQAAACASVTQWSRVRSPFGTSFLSKVFFRGFPSFVRQISGSFRPTRFPYIIWPSQSSFACRSCKNECVSEWCVSSLMFVCFGGGPGIGLITHLGRPSISLCGQKNDPHNSLSRQVMAL